MRTTKFAAVLALVCVAGAAYVEPAPARRGRTPQTSTTEGPLPPPKAGPSSSSQSPPVAPQTPARPSAIKTQTRLITVDVIATDGHGNPVRNLTQEDFQVSEEHLGAQKIARFEFIDTAVAADATGVAQPVAAPGVFSNRPATRLKVPPTVLLMDALNTGTQQQIQVRRDMILFLKKLPADTPVAVFLLGHTLHVVQNFTTDPKLLQAAVDRARRPTDLDPNPQDDADSASNIERNSPLKVPEDVLERLEDFEKEQYMEQISQRVEETASAMFSIAKFLGGYPGRKNLIWFSESFPIWIAPTADFGSDPFEGSNQYGAQVREAAEQLTDARVSVYPVDARGLEPSSLYTASQDANIDQRNPGASLGGTLRREDDDRTQSQATMEEVADDTGGKTCKNTNDLSGCVLSALHEGSAYYELAYYPVDAKWDGHFHRITVKTIQHGVKLAYRRGYFATTASTDAQKTPTALLQEACSDALPSGAISLSVETLPLAPAPGQQAGAKYLMTISPMALSLTLEDGSQQSNLQMAICEFAPKADSFQFYPHDLSQPASAALFQSWQAHGIRNLFDYAARPDAVRLRFAVLDVPSGATGAVDVPAHPREFANVPELRGPGATGAPATPVASAAPSASATSPGPPITHVNFRVGASVSSLDWSGGMLLYHGDIGIDRGAPAFFKSIYGTNYHCNGGALVSNDAQSTAKPNMLFTFRNPNGTGALVELGGTEPAYSGNLTVDQSARAFFDYLWKLCHCQQP
jgi:VWFA-related protein